MKKTDDSHDREHEKKLISDRTSFKTPCYGEAWSRSKSTRGCVASSDGLMRSSTDLAKEEIQSVVRGRRC